MDCNIFRFNACFKLHYNVGFRPPCKAFTSAARLLRRQADSPSKVGMTGFEPATPSSRTKYATGLRYIPKTKNNNIVFTDQYKAFNSETVSET